MQFLYSWDTFANLPAFTTSSFYGGCWRRWMPKVRGGTCSVAQTPEWYAKITFKSNASKTAFKNRTNSGRATGGSVY